MELCDGYEHGTPYDAKFCLPYLIATAVTHGDVRMDAFTEARLHDPRTAALARKVKLHLDREIDATFPGQRAARIKVETVDGRVLEHFQPTRRGDPELPLSDADLAAKYTELAVPVMGTTAARRLLDACGSLESLATVRDLPFSTAVEAAAASA